MTKAPYSCVNSSWRGNVCKIYRFKDGENDFSITDMELDDNRRFWLDQNMFDVYLNKNKNKSRACKCEPNQRAIKCLVLKRPDPEDKRNRVSASKPYLCKTCVNNTIDSPGVLFVGVSHFCRKCSKAMNIQRPNQMLHKKHLFFGGITIYKVFENKELGAIKKPIMCVDLCYCNDCRPKPVIAQSPIGSSDDQISSDRETAQATEIISTM